MASEAIETIRAYLVEAKKAAKAAGGNLKRLEVSKALYDEARKVDSMLGKDLVVDDILITTMDPRNEGLSCAAQYAHIRWDVSMSYDDIASLLKAVATEDIMGLAPLIVDQHMDEWNFPDPVDEMSHGEVRSMVLELENIGFPGIQL